MSKNIKFGVACSPGIGASTQLWAPSSATIMLEPPLSSCARVPPVISLFPLRSCHRNHSSAGVELFRATTCNQKAALMRATAPTGSRSSTHQRTREWGWGHSSDVLLLVLLVVRALATATGYRCLRNRTCARNAPRSAPNSPHNPRRGHLLYIATRMPSATASPLPQIIKRTSFGE